MKPEPKNKKTAFSWDQSLCSQRLDALQKLNKNLKKSSAEFFEFDLTETDLFKSGYFDDEMTQIKSELSTMYWIYWKSKMIMNSWYKTKHPKPESIDIGQLSDAKMITDIAQDLCYKDVLPSKTEKFLE